MSEPDDRQVLLFSYGTLRQENVQLAIFGRRIEGRPDALPGYAVTPVRITDPHVIATSDTVIDRMVKPISFEPLMAASKGFMPSSM